MHWRAESDFLVGEEQPIWAKRPPQGQGCEDDPTEGEGTILAIIHRHQPVTAYQLRSLGKTDLVANFNTSKGKIYPVIQRLLARQLLRAEDVVGDRRKAKRLYCTARGQQALRNWLRIRAEDEILTDDPLRDRVQSLSILKPNEQIVWLVQVRQRLANELRQIERQAPKTLLGAIATDNAASLYRARMDWLERSIAQIAATS